ncbi:MAG TPA: FtsX-like permease family protein, partial [Bryobacteraceae bacterium]|nr:FtsX-like permease family protein [Bryobacteraceae bacterium]
LIGGVVGVLLAGMVTGAVGKVGETYFNQLHSLSITPGVAAICLGVALLIGVVSSFIPAFHAARTNILDSLRYAG